MSSLLQTYLPTYLPTYISSPKCFVATPKHKNQPDTTFYNTMYYITYYQTSSMPKCLFWIMRAYLIYYILKSMWMDSCCILYLILYRVFKKKYQLLFCLFCGFRNILKTGSVHFSTAQPFQNPNITIFLACGAAPTYALFVRALHYIWVCVEKI